MGILGGAANPIVLDSYDLMGLKDEESSQRGEGLEVVSDGDKSTDGAESSVSEGGDEALILIGKSASKVVKTMATRRLSKWAMRFTEPR